MIVLADRLQTNKKLFKNHIYANRDGLKFLEKMRTAGREARINVIFSRDFQLDAVKQDWMLCKPGQNIILILEEIKRAGIPLALAKWASHP